MSFVMLRRACAALACALTLAFSGAARAAPPDLVVFATQAFGSGVDLRERKEGDAAVLEARREGKLLGVAFSTWDLIKSVGYSGQPIDIWATLDPSLAIGKAELVRQTEPLLVIGLRPEQLEELVASLKGLNVQTLQRVAPAGGGKAVDHIAGATISSNVLRDSTIRSARTAARIAGLLGGPGRILRDRYTEGDWRTLMGERAIVEHKLREKDFPLEGEAIQPDKPLLDIYLALATPAGIGVHLLGRKQYEQFMSTAGPDDNLVFVGANGLLSVKGSEWRQSGVFERLAIAQGPRTIRLTKAMYRPFAKVEAEYAPELRERAIFVIPHDTGFDPSKPWTLQTLAVRAAPDGSEKTRLFDTSYTIPSVYLAPQPKAAPATEKPLWRRDWERRKVDIGALGALLGALVLILLLEDQLVARQRLYKATRIAFMVVTLAFIGFYARAQLSVVHVVTFLHALRTDFQWSFFLLDPLIFLLWGFVAVAMLFWGRGVFCGWLCPFGALQELLNEIARRLRIPQIELPWALHERLWIIKYLIFLAIFALSLNDMRMAFVAAEAEPFKTVVALRFMRAAPFVAYALGALAAGLFVRRAFCRYLCPLGAALALPARLRMFEWLKRRPQCGRECRQCAVHCPVGAIYPSGAISPNECIYCLNCQSLYHDANQCLGLKARAARQAARAQISAKGASDAQ